MDFLNLPSPLEELRHHPGKERGIRIFIKRDDLIHSEISGNKWRKLKYNIQEAKEKGASILVSAGGPWSNHLAATAAAGRLLGLKTKAFIRGVEPKEWSETLLFCKSNEMELNFLSKNSFDTIDFSVEIADDEYWIPLGGENSHGIKGCKEILEEISIDFDLVCVSVGTGTTMMGIGGGLEGQQIIGFSALKDTSQHSDELNKWLNSHGWSLLTHQYSGEGFAKSSVQLEDFIVDFYQQNKIILEPVYTGKMMMGVFDMINTRRVQNDTNIVCIHTGGLQGLKGFPDLHKRLFTS